MAYSALTKFEIMQRKMAEKQRLREIARADALRSTRTTRTEAINASRRDTSETELSKFELMQKRMAEKQRKRNNANAKHRNVHIRTPPKSNNDHHGGKNVKYGKKNTKWNLSRKDANQNVYSNTNNNLNCNYNDSKMNDAEILDNCNLSIVDAINLIDTELNEIRSTISNGNIMISCRYDKNVKSTLLRKLDTVNKRLNQTKNKLLKPQLQNNDDNLQTDELQKQNVDNRSTLALEAKIAKFKVDFEKLETQSGANVTATRCGQVLSLCCQIAEIENNIEHEKEKMNNYFNNLKNDMIKYWNALKGNDVIDEFEQKWTQWNVDDTLNWFSFVLKCKKYSSIDDGNVNSDCKNDESDDSDTSDASESESESNGSRKREKVDYKKVRNLLIAINFRAKKNLPLMLKSFQFKQFGFQNKNDCKLLCKQTKLLMEKYPKKSKKSKSKRKQKFKQPNNDHDLIEGFVQETHD